MSCKFYTIDRVEGDIGVLYDDEDNKTDIPMTELPEGAKEGDILRYDEENKEYIIDKEKTNETKSNIEDRFKKLFKK